MFFRTGGTTFKEFIIKELQKCNSFLYKYWIKHWFVF